MAKHRWTRRLLWSALATLLLLSIAGVVLRDAIFSAAAARILARRGIHCEPISAHVPLAIPPSPIGLAPTRCTLAEGPLASIELEGPIGLQLEGLGLGSLTCASVEFDLRPRAPRDVKLDALGDVTRLAGFDQLALQLMFDSAALSRGRNPPLRAAHARVRRAGKPELDLQDLRVTPTASGMIVTAQRASIERAALLGDGPLRLEATPAAVRVTFSGNLKVTIVLDHLDAAKPSAAFSLSADPQPTAK